eukprot:13667750-Alexandrium_andersonii.AAC.1
MGASVQNACKRSPGRRGKDSGGNCSMSTARAAMASRRRTSRSRKSSLVISAEVASNTTRWGKGMSTDSLWRRRKTDK